MVVFPRRNEEDVRSLPEEVKEGLEVVLVGDIGELTDIVLGTEKVA